jgi:hypothetical protein
VALSAVPPPEGTMSIFETLLEHMDSDCCRIAEIVETFDSSGETIHCLK